MKQLRTSFLQCMIVVLALLISPLAADAARAGDVDLSFDPGSSVNKIIKAVARQSDGKWIIGGSFETVHGALRGHVARLNVDGSTDHTFMNGMAGANGNVSAVAIQPDGRIVIAGDFDMVNDSWKPHIARLNPDGSVDETFSGLNSYSGYVDQIHLQEDGRILISGSLSFGDDEARYRIARLNADGNLDDAFNDAAADALSAVWKFVVQRNGKIILFGPAEEIEGENRSRIVCLEPDGAREEGFSTNVYVNGWITAVAPQIDGKIVIAGFFTEVNGGPKATIARLGADGSLDSSFSYNPDLSWGAISVLAIDNNGKITIGGSFTAECSDSSSMQRRIGITRLNADGTFDAGWGYSHMGLDEAPILRGDTIQTIVLQSDGKMLVAGEFGFFNGVPARRIAQLNADGTMDASFQAGKPGADYWIEAILPQADGKVIVGGAFTTVGGISSSRLSRLKSDGTVDESFSRYTIDDSVFTLAQQADGKIIVGGAFKMLSQFGGTNIFARKGIARLFPDGSLDTAFGEGLEGANGFVYRVLVQPDGRVLIAGDFTMIHGNARGGIARLNSNGTIDNTFANGEEGIAGQVRAMLLQEDGKVVITGTFRSFNGVTKNQIARLNTDGTLDSSFGDCVVLTNSQSVQPIAMQKDGKILVGSGWIFDDPNSYPSLLRLNVNGTLDSTFEPDPTITAVYELAVQSDDKILCYGQANGVASLMRLGKNGEVDTNFREQGVHPNGLLTTIALGSDGKIYLGGAFDEVNNVARDCLVRLHSVATPPNLQILSLSANHLYLKWDAEVGETYRLQFKPTLHGEWSDVLTTNAASDKVSITDTVSGNHGFFRLAQ